MSGSTIQRCCGRMEFMLAFNLIGTVLTTIAIMSMCGRTPDQHGQTGVVAAFCPGCGKEIEIVPEVPE